MRTRWPWPVKPLDTLTNCYPTLDGQVDSSTIKDSVMRIRGQLTRLNGILSTYHDDVAVVAAAIESLKTMNQRLESL
jgi:RNase P/RNase MRP subunit POP5